MFENFKSHSFNHQEIENTETRTNAIKDLIQQLPPRNFHLLRIIVKHLRNVANHSHKNLMTVSNLGICFAPTLMRGPDENSLSMGEVKYSNVVANTLIEKYDSIFNDPRINRTQNLTQPSIRQNPIINLNEYDEQFGLVNHSDYILYSQFIMVNNPNTISSFTYNNPIHNNKVPYRSDKVITLYACVGDTESELSFGPNEFIVDGEYL